MCTITYTWEASCWAAVEGHLYQFWQRCVVKLATGGAVKEVFWRVLRLHNIYPHLSQWHSCKSPKPSNKPQPPAQGPDALKCREYKALSVEKHLPSSKQKFSPSVMKSDNFCWLATARISLSIEIGPAQVLAIKAGLAIPWNKLRLLRRYDIKMQCSNGVWDWNHCNRSRVSVADIRRWFLQNDGK